MSKDVFTPCNDKEQNAQSTAGRGAKLSINFQDKPARSSVPSTRRRPVFETDDDKNNSKHHDDDKDKLLQSYDSQEIQREAERQPPRMIIEPPASKDWKNRRKHTIATDEKGNKRVARNRNNGNDEEQEAVRRLTEGEKLSNNHGESLTIDMQEQEILQRDVDSLPEMADLKAYEAVPVEEFGKAMLRGMGWKDEDTNSSESTSSSVNKRPAFLGLGAKPNPLTSEELGSWGTSSSNKNQAKIEKTYVPLVKVSKLTGEIIKDESPQQQQQQHREDEKHSNNMRDNDRYDSKRRSRERNDRYDRHGSKRDYDYEREHNHNRRRRYDDHSSRSRRNDY